MCVCVCVCAVDREEEGRKKVRQLQKQIAEVKRNRESELQQRREMIAHLKDQLQEMKAKTSMEGKYVKKVCDVSVAQTQKRCVMSEKALQNEIAVCCNQRRIAVGWAGMEKVRGRRVQGAPGSFLHPLRGVITPNFRTTPPGFVS